MDEEKIVDELAASLPNQPKQSAKLADGMFALARAINRLSDVLGASPLAKFVPSRPGAYCDACNGRGYVLNANGASASLCLACLGKGRITAKPVPAVPSEKTEQGT